MLRLYPEQLRSQLSKELRAVYLLLGNDPLLLQESQDAVRQIAHRQGFNECYIVQIDNNTNWQKIFSFCQAMSLFSCRQILILLLPENGLNEGINAHLITVTKLLHGDLLLILRGNKLTKIQESTTWFTQLTTKAVVVSCQTPEWMQLPKWLVMRGHQHNLRIDKESCKLLCYYYEGNLLALAQALKRFSLLWPDGNITLNRVKQAVNDAAHFTPFHWVDALFSAKIKRAFHILQQLRLEGNEPVVLIRTLQRELLFIITLKRQSVIIPLRELFDKHRVWKNRRTIITEVINHLSYDQFRQALHLLSKAELAVKQDSNQSVWGQLENLSILLCHKTLGKIFIKN